MKCVAENITFVGSSGRVYTMNQVRAASYAIRLNGADNKIRNIKTVRELYHIFGYEIGLMDAKNLIEDAAGYEEDIRLTCDKLDAICRVTSVDSL